MESSERKTKKTKKRKFQGEIWEEWALTYGRNGFEWEHETRLAAREEELRLVRNLPQAERPIIRCREQSVLPHRIERSDPFLQGKKKTKSETGKRTFGMRLTRD